MKTLIATLAIIAFSLTGLMVSDSAEASPSYNYYGSTGNYLGKTQENPFGGYNHYGSTGNYLGKTQENSFGW